MLRINKMKRFVGFDRNGKKLFIGDKVIIYYDYTENQKYGEGKLVTYNGGWIYIKMENEMHPYTNKLTLDMGQQGINILNFEYEKIEEEEVDNNNEKLKVGDKVEMFLESDISKIVVVGTISMIDEDFKKAVVTYNGMNYMKSLSKLKLYKND